MVRVKGRIEEELWCVDDLVKEKWFWVK